MKQRIIIVLLSLVLPFLAKAQDFSVGFKAGLNFSSIDGPSEVDADGMELEEYSLTTGFIFGARFNVKFTDIFGARAELLYGQKGAEYSFDGPSFWRFTTLDERTLLSTGTRRTVLKITNSYLELPVLGYARFGRIELGAGLSIGALLSSRGTGELVYSGETSDGVPISPFTIILNYNYQNNDLETFSSGDPEIRMLGGNTVSIPNTIEAYFESTGTGDRIFNTLDLGLNLEIAFFLNSGLYIGLRGQYGLSDITKTEQDLSRVSLDEDDQFILRDDVDRNISVQASLGFSF